MNPSEGCPEILVCQAGSCRAAGSEAVFVEIEELAKLVGEKCTVRESGCLGLCSQAPSAVVVGPRVKGQRMRLESEHTRIRSTEASAKIVKQATGEMPRLDDPEVSERLAGLRQTRIRQQATKNYRWNTALFGFGDQIAKAGGQGIKSLELEFERAQLLAKAGYCAEAYRIICKLRLRVAASPAQTYPLLLESVDILGKLGWRAELERMADDIERDFGVSMKERPSFSMARNVRELYQAMETARKECETVGDASADPGNGKGTLANSQLSSNNLQFASMPTRIENYSLWHLEAVTPVSQHSAVFRFRSTDRKRGTPHPRGRGKMAEPKTWHTTLLAALGPNDEGPLPWIERDYTPVSCAKDWEKGSCDILIKIYSDGLATQWLYRMYQEYFSKSAASSSMQGDPAVTGESSQQAADAPKNADRKVQVWLSQPVMTLQVPQLIDPFMSSGNQFFPKGVLLLLAGTGVVAAPQVLHHREPMNFLNIATKRIDQLKVPIDLMLSCRKNDLLMLPEIAQWCQQSLEKSSEENGVFTGLRQFTLLLTEAAETKKPNNSELAFASNMASSGGSAGSTATVPFPEADSAAAAQALELLRTLSNVNVVEATRLNRDLLADAVESLPEPFRVIVSGPSGFNGGVKDILKQLDVDDDAITILTA